MTHEGREEKDDRPSHHEVDRKAQGRNRAFRQRFVEDAEEHHRPLQRGDEDALPAADHHESDRRIGAGDGDEYANVVEDMEHGLVLRRRRHRMVERRCEQHQKNRDHEDAHRDGRHDRLGIADVGPNRRERQRRQRDERHDAVRQRIGDLLAPRRYVDPFRFFPFHTFRRFVHAFRKAFVFRRCPARSRRGQQHPAPQRHPATPPHGRGRPHTGCASKIAIFFLSLSARV